MFGEDDKNLTADQRIERLEGYVEQLLKMIAQRDKLISAICDNTASIWERVRTIQYSVFPNLADDLLELARVVNFTDDNSGHEFDKRPPDTGKKSEK